MTSLYSNELSQYLHSLPWPKGFKWEIHEYETQLRMRVFRDNINSLDSDDKLKLATILGEALRKINDSGIPLYIWKDEGDGNNVRSGLAQ